MPKGGVGKFTFTNPSFGISIGREPASEMDRSGIELEKLGEKTFGMPLKNCSDCNCKITRNGLIRQ